MPQCTEAEYAYLQAVKRGLNDLGAKEFANCEYARLYLSAEVEALRDKWARIERLQKEFGKEMEDLEVPFRDPKTTLPIVNYIMGDAPEITPRQVKP